MMRRTTLQVPCTVEIAQTFDSLHAHVDLHDVEVGPGDEVIVHDPPGLPPPGETVVVTRSATVIRATWLDRLLAKVQGYAELTELYEVGFEGKHA